MCYNECITKVGDIMAISKKQQASVHKYVKENYDRIELTVPKGRKADIQAHAATKGESVNAFINRAINETMDCDTPVTMTEGERK
jgi:predicted HicB family RNase H-like nuclease